MSGKLEQLAERRSRLVAQAAAQRTSLARHLEPWRARLAVADRGLAALRYVRRRPTLLAGAALLLAIWRPKGVGAWLRRGWVGWQVVRRLRG